MTRWRGCTAATTRSSGNVSSRWRYNTGASAVASARTESDGASAAGRTGAGTRGGMCARGPMHPEAPSATNVAAAAPQASRRRRRVGGRSAAHALESARADPETPRPPSDHAGALGFLDLGTEAVTFRVR